MAIAAHQLQNYLGFAAQGDLGPWTMYSSKNFGRPGIVIFAKAWLKDATSPRQKAHRDRIRAAAQAWKSLTAQQRTNWEACTKKLSLRLTGYNLFTHYHMKGDTSNIETLERQSGLELLPI